MPLYDLSCAAGNLKHKRCLSTIKNGPALTRSFCYPSALVASSKWFLSILQMTGNTTRRQLSL